MRSRSTVAAEPGLVSRSRCACASARSRSALVELGGQGVQDGLGELIEVALVSQDGLQVRPAPAGRGGGGHGDGQRPRLEGPLGARADDGRAEADRGDVPFPDAPDAERQPGLTSAQAALVWAEHRARVAQRRALGRILRREGGSQQQRAGRGQLPRLLDVRGDDRGMPPQELGIIMVAAAEVAEQAGRQLAPPPLPGGSSRGGRSGWPARGPGATPRRAGKAARRPGPDRGAARRARGGRSLRLAEPAGQLRRREHGQGGLGALVEIAATALQAVVAAAGRRVEHRRGAVVVTDEPVPGQPDARPPARPGR